MEKSTTSNAASGSKASTSDMNATGCAVDELLQTEGMFRTAEIALMVGDGMELEREDIEGIATTLRFARERLAKCIEQVQSLTVCAA